MSVTEIDEVPPRSAKDDADERAAHLTRTFRDFPVRPSARNRAFDISSRQLNMALGWLSVGAGLAELLAPRALHDLQGVRQRPVVTRLSGLRQLVNGIGLLSGRAPTAFSVARIAGDALDLALLGTAVRSQGVRPIRAALAATAIAGITALDIFAAQQSRRDAVARARGPRSVNCQIDIDSSPDKLYAFWRDVENLPRFITHLRAVQPIGKGKTHWIINAPAGLLIEWDIEIVDAQPGRLLAWRTLPGSSVNHYGVIAFTPLPDDRGTRINLDLEYSAPSEPVSAALARMLGGNPAVQIAQDLRRLKALIEGVDAASGTSATPARDLFAALKR